MSLIIFENFEAFFCFNFQQNMFRREFVIRNFESHGMRPLSRGIRRRNDNYVSERPIVPDDQDLEEIQKRDKSKYNEHFAGRVCP